MSDSVASDVSFAVSSSISSIVTCVRKKLKDWPLETRITAGYTAGGTTITVADGTLFAASGGDEWEFADGTYEIILGRSVSSNTVTPKFGHRGTTNQDHASGAVLRSIPRFSDDDIQTAISEAVDGLAPTVWTTATTSLTFSASATHFDAPSGFLRPIWATQKDAASTNNFYYQYGFDGQPPNRGQIYVRRGQNTSDFSSGIALYVPAFYNTTNTITLTYAKAVTTSTIESGLMSDTVCWGAVANLMGVQGAGRSGSFNPRDLSAASTLDSLRMSSLAEQKYQLGKRRLAADLNRKYPLAKTWRV